MCAREQEAMTKVDRLILAVENLTRALERGDGGTVLFRSGTWGGQLSGGATGGFSAPNGLPDTPGAPGGQQAA